MFNTDLMETLELGYMLDCAEAIVEGAVARRRVAGHTTGRISKTAMMRTGWRTFWSTDVGWTELTKKPVKITEFEPKERKY